ncbi:MAG: Stp1/IreP family PP2C-type Ser/Thr phosphatase [Bacillota bacterium]
MQVAGLTNRGLERSRNEDSYFVKTEIGLVFLVVADGMGGHQAGNVASSLVVSTAEKLWEKLDPGVLLSTGGARQLLSRFITEANEIIFSEAGNNLSKRGMGTTITAGLLCDNHLTIGHVGDSRAYLIKDDQIELLTRDHSLLEELIQSGQVAPEEAQSHPQRHVLTRALGISRDLDIDFTEQEIDDNSILLFCTDGLTSLVHDKEILELSREKPESHKLAEALINLANDRGGYDNITVVVATGIGGQ